MKTDIWHLPTDIPENGREILCMRENKWATGWGKKYTVRNAKSRINPSYDAYITKWCYLDDLLEQSSKIERLTKALEVAKGALIGISTPEIQTEMFNSVRFAKGALNGITQALEKASQ
jgi:hypothetical protein